MMSIPSYKKASLSDLLNPVTEEVREMTDDNQQSGREHPSSSTDGPSPLNILSNEQSYETSPFGRKRVLDLPEDQKAQRKAEQNRAAQKAFRLRKEAYVKKLEKDISYLKNKLQDYDKVCFKLEMMQGYEKRCKELESLVQKHYAERENWLVEKTIYERKLLELSSRLRESSYTKPESHNLNTLASIVDTVAKSTPETHTNPSSSKDVNNNTF